MQLLLDFFNQKFLQPLCHYYTPEATIVYGLILCAAALGTYKLLQKLKIRIDKNFFLALLPFILYGGWTRALRDHNLGIYTTKLFCSPPIYFVIFAIALASLLFGILIQRKFKIEYYKIMATVGILFLIYNLTLTVINNWFAFFVILGLTSFWAIIFFGISYLKPKLLSKINAGILTAHTLDASSSFTAMQFFGYLEQHVLPRALVSLTGPWVMFPLKIIVVLAVLLMLDKYCKDNFFKNFLKIIILILGLALGIRNFLTVSMLMV